MVSPLFDRYMYYSLNCYPTLGAFFGTTFAPLMFQTFRELAPAPFCPPLPTLQVTSRVTSSSRAPSESPSGSVEGNLFENPNPYGGKKRPFGKVYTPTLFGFRVSEKARSGPRMRWLRLRPETGEELDAVDWRGQWKTDLEDEDGEGDDEEDAEDRALENFDDDLLEDGDEDEEEEEEEEETPGPPAPQPASTSGRKPSRGKHAIPLFGDWARGGDSESSASSVTSVETPDDEAAAVVPSKVHGIGAGYLHIVQKQQPEWATLESPPALLS